MNGIKNKFRNAFRSDMIQVAKDFEIPIIEIDVEAYGHDIKDFSKNKDRQEVGEKCLEYNK